MGRGTKYDPNVHPVMAKYMARCGLTDKEIAKEFGISIRTLNYWKKSHVEFLHSLKENKKLVDAMVEDSLLKKAIGYEVEETEVVATKDGKNTRIKKTKKWIHDTTAAIFWLKNRQPERWRELQSVEHSGEVTNKTNLDLSYMSDEELQEEIKKLEGIKLDNE